ncbi:hypothetical protein MKX03_000081 [Papaver bracteatum]|nr:hypothetical protein MKX03_000081 [Papaver bracteatum]
MAANGNASGKGIISNTVDLENFSKCLKAFYSHWKENKTNYWGPSDALKKASLLNEVKKSKKDATGGETVMHIKVKNDRTALTEYISKSSDNGSPIGGYIAKEAPEGNLLELWSEKLKTSNLQLADLEKIIDDAKKVTHLSLMEDTEMAVLATAKVKVKLKADNVDICYPPVFQCGGEFDLRPSASSNEEACIRIQQVIICAVGSCYNSYCLNVARTFLIDANPIDANAMQSKAYGVLLKAQDAAIGALKAGSKVSVAYEAALAVFEKDGPELVPNLTKTAGTGIGLEFRESGLNLNAKNDRVLKAGMVFNFSLLLADTVIVRENIPEVVTMISSKPLKDLAYLFNEDDEEEEAKPKAKAEPNGSESLLSKATLRSDNQEMSKEELRRQHQAELSRQKNEETARRLAGSGAGDGPVQVLRKFRWAIHLKEVSFRSKDPRHISEVVNMIKTLRPQVASRESEKATLVTQEKLQLAGTKFKLMRLDDLWIRGSKLSGTLEAHVNGFRYSTNKPDERVDIMYSNVKHAFFQPAEKEMITLLHFHLHNHIMVGTKKTKDVQFYVEVMDVVQTLGGGRRSNHDPDEIEEEQRERDRKNRINMDFSNFVNKVNDLWGQPQFRGIDLEFDQPLRELGFHGVPYKASAFIVPTSSCLVELIETPFLVVSLNEIEIVNLERVGLGQKNFDMTIVFKDLKRDVLRIDSIPSTALDGIKEWLDTTDLKYYESRLNLNWRSILKTITDDPEKFIEDGGWEFLNMEVSDSGSDDTEDSDQGYQTWDGQSDSEQSEEFEKNQTSLTTNTEF